LKRRNNASTFATTDLGIEKINKRRWRKIKKVLSSRRAPALAFSITAGILNGTKKYDTKKYGTKKMTQRKIVLSEYFDKNI
jgi:hypothetical protein